MQVIVANQGSCCKLAKQSCIQFLLSARGLLKKNPSASYTNHVRWLTIHPRVANFLQCICPKNHENWLAVDKVIAKISRLTFLAHPVENLRHLLYSIAR